MTDTKTAFRSFAEIVQRPLAAALHKCVLLGTRELEQLRARSGPLCPQCGGHLILRRVGFGRDAGKEFWDCSNVPKCFLTLAAETVTWPEPSVTAAAA